MDAETEKLIKQLLSEKEESLKTGVADSDQITYDAVDATVTSDETLGENRDEAGSSSEDNGICYQEHDSMENSLLRDSTGNHEQDMAESGPETKPETADSSHASVKLRPFDFQKEQTIIRGARSEFRSTKNAKNNFAKGCKWSPDGACLLTASEDRVLRLFDVYNFVQRLATSNLENEEPEHDMSASLRMQAPDMIYDFSWYPFMNSSDPSTCCFLSTSRESPIHLYDAFNGSLRCSYRAFNHVDEFVAANSVAFSSDGAKIVCGYDKCIRIFDLSIPGRTCSSHSTFTKKTRRGLKGIISCFDFHPVEPDLFACGSYGKSIGLFSLNSGNFQFRLDGQSGGVTSVKFAPCGNRLFAAGRKDDEILCFDLRNLGQVLFVLRRPMTTNQRIQFDLSADGRYLFSGDTTGNVHVWDLLKFEENSFDDDGSLTTIRSFKAHDQAVSGASLHPFLPLLATTSGQRHFMEPIARDDDGDGDSEDDDDGDDDSDDGSAELDIEVGASHSNVTSGDSPVWRSVVPSVLDNSLKLWLF